MVCWIFDLNVICQVLTIANLLHAISGAMGSALSIAVFFPLETVRTRIQACVAETPEHGGSVSVFLIQNIYRKEGIKGLYKGIGSLVISLTVTNFLYFYTFHSLKAVLCQSGYNNYVHSDFLFGIVAGCVAVLISNPLWVACTRLKLQDTKIQIAANKELQRPRYFGTLDCIRKIVKHEGWHQLWSGTKASLWLVSNPAVQFMVYEFLKRNLQLYLNSPDLGDSWYFVCGAIAKIVATLVTYPLQVVQTRLRAGIKDNSHLRASSSLVSILRREGFTGLYAGLEAKLTQTVLTSALMFMTYEKIVNTLFAAFGITRS